MSLSECSLWNSRARFCGSVCLTFLCRINWGCVAFQTFLCRLGPSGVLESLSQLQFLWEEKRVGPAQPWGGCSLCWMSAQQPWPGAVLSGDLDKAVGPVSGGRVMWAGQVPEKVPVTESYLGNSVNRVPGSAPHKFCSFSRYGIETGCPPF